MTALSTTHMVLRMAVPGQLASLHSDNKPLCCCCESQGQLSQNHSLVNALDSLTLWDTQMYATFLLQRCWYAAVHRLVVRFANIQVQKRLLRSLCFRWFGQISMRSVGLVSTNQKLTEHSCCSFVDVQHPPVARLGGVQEQKRFLIAGQGPHELHIGLHGL